MIRSFSCPTTEKIFNGTQLSRKELKKLGNLNLRKANNRLIQLHLASENDLLTAPFLHYHSLKGTNRYSIDANSRRSKWRITFRWEDHHMTLVELVKIEDTH